MGKLYLCPDPKNIRVLRRIVWAIHQLNLTRPAVIAVGGPAGAGKTTLAEHLQKMLGKDQSVMIDLDDYQFSRIEKREMGVSGHHPKGTKVDAVRWDLRELIQERLIEKPRYDFATGDIIAGGIVAPQKHIIMCGVAAMFDGVQQLADISVFLDIDDDLLLRIKLDRDVNERGYSPERVVEYFDELQRDYRAHIAPAMPWASMVVQVGEGHVLGVRR